MPTSGTVRKRWRWSPVRAALRSPVLAAGAACRAGRRPGRRPTATYWVYVGAESADLIHRIRFGPDGAAVEKTIADRRARRRNGGTARPRDLARRQVPPHDHRARLPRRQVLELRARPRHPRRPRASCSATSPPRSTSRPTASTPSSANFNLHGDMVPSSHVGRLHADQRPKSRASSPAPCRTAAASTRRASSSTPAA